MNNFFLKLEWSALFKLTDKGEGLTQACSAEAS